MKVTFKNNLGSVLLKVLFLAVVIEFYFLVALIIQPSLILFAQKTGFLLNREYFVEFTSIPGGISVYISNFLMQFFESDWVGAFIIVAIFALLILFITNLAQRFKKSNLYNIIIIIVIIGGGSIILTDYYFYFSSLIKIVICLLFVWGLLKTQDIDKWIFYVLLIPFTVGVFYLAGAMSMYLFSLIVLLNSIRLFEKKIAGVVFAGASVLINLIICVLSYRIFNIDTTSNWVGLSTESPVFLRYKQENQLYTYYCLIVLLVIIPYIAKSFNPKSSKNIFPAIGNVLFYILLIVGIAAPFTMAINMDNQVKSKLLVHYYADKCDWDNVMKESFNTEVYDVLVNAQYNRALHFKGTLLSDFFTYPQPLGFDGLIPDKKQAGEVTLICAGIYYDLGYISEAIHWLYEAQMLIPYSPDILKKLTDCYIIAGKPELALKYLDILGQNFMHRKWVKAKREQLKITKPQTDIINKINMMPDKRIALSDSKERLKLLLSEDSTNRMAYEYLQLYYLVNNQLGDFYFNLKYLENAGYKTMPRIFQEAIILYSVRAGIFNNNPDELRVSKDCYNDFAEVTKIRMQFKNDPNGAQLLLSKSFGKTYWYYILYESPLVTKAELKFREVGQ